MKTTIRNLTFILTLLCAAVPGYSQDKKIWASGAARSVFQQNELDADIDTVSPSKLNSGHAMVDLAINARPNDQTFLHAMVRIRNDFGGFWGSGVTFDMRQLYLKGLVHDAVRYQVGDIDYKLSPYTFFNNVEELSSHSSEAMDIYRELMRYDMFYTDDNTWRQQGAALDFSILFPEMIKELQFDMFMFRNRPTDFGTQNDRIFFGGNATMVQSEKFNIGMNYIDLMDVIGTSKNDQGFHNPVISGTTELIHSFNDLDLQFKSESGISEMYTLNDPGSTALRDFFMDLNLSVEYKKNLRMGVNYSNVGPEFRSIGAQNKRVNFAGQAQLYTRIGNEQLPRPITQLDLIQDPSLYQLSLDPRLEAYAPQYDNVRPFGVATPNRKGFTGKASYSNDNEFLNVNAELAVLSEVVGQGTDQLRDFQVIEGDILLRFDTLMPGFDKPLELSIGYTGQNTKRTTKLAEGNIDLSSNFLDIGVKVGVIENMDLIGNFRSINASGNELLSARDAYTELVDYEQFSTEMKQDFLTIALRYHFDDRNKLNVVWQKLNYEDSTGEVPPFTVNQFGIVYSMFF